MKTHLVELFIPIVMIYLVFRFPDQLLDISITPLGRFISIILILYYTSIHKYYGLLICAFVILYYQMDCVEGMARWNGNSILMDTMPTDQTIPKHNYIRSYTQQTKIPLFYQKPDKKSVLLEYENNKIVDISCSKGQCKATVIDQLDNQEELMYPKTDENWASQIWNTWFTSNQQPI